MYLIAIFSLTPIGVPTLYHGLPGMSILHPEVVPCKHILLEQEHRVDKRDHYIHLTGGALLVDVLIKVGVLGAAGVGEIYLQQRRRFDYLLDCDFQL